MIRKAGSVGTFFSIGPNRLPRDKLVTRAREEVSITLYEEVADLSLTRRQEVG